MFDGLSKSIASRALRSDAGRALLDKAVRDYLSSEAGSDIAGVLVSPFDTGRPAEWQHDPKKQVQHLKGWVFTAVNAIIRGVTSVPLRFYIEREDGKREEVEFSHPIRELFRRVNNVKTFRDLMAELVVHLELTGNAYWSVSREDGTPTELWTLPSQYTRVVPSKEEWIAGYTLERGGRKKFYKAENVLHFLHANPENLYYGKSPLQAAAEAVDADEGISESQYRHFAKGLHPDQVVLRTPERLTPAQVKRYRRELQAGYASTARASSVFIAHGGVDMELFSAKPREMDYLASSTATRQRILGIYGVPEFFAGIPEGYNKASSVSAEIVFSKYTIAPKLQYIEGIITERLCPMFDPNLVAEFDSPVPRDEEAHSKRVTLHWNSGILTLNETRSELGYDKVETEEGDKRKPPKREAEVALQLAAPSLPEEVVKQEPTEKELDAILTYVFDREAEAAHFESAMGGRVAEALRRGASLEAARIKREVDVDRPEFIGDLLERSRGRWDETVGETTIKGLKASLAEGLAAHETGPQLTARVRKLFRETYANRATTIARTEIVSAANAGALRAGEIAGMTRKVWIATLDEYTRPDHLAADGQEVPIGESFKVGDDSLRYPGDPAAPISQIANCRCSHSTSIGREKSFYRSVDKAFRAAEWKLERKAEADVVRYFKDAGDRVEEKLREWLKVGEAGRA